MENSPSIKPIAYKYGIGLALYSILVLIVSYVLNLSPENKLNYLIGGINLIVSIAVFTYAIKEYKNQNRGYLSLSEALKTGLAVAVVSGVITAIYSYFHYSYIFPEFIEMTMEQQRAGMLEAGMPEEQIEQSMNMMSFMRAPWFYGTITLIYSLFFGFILSLIIGLIMKKKDPALA
ncbi:DUF4199 domain-containing protein [Mesonia sp. K7]|uniref:DUF4199 domain-containing protein n=1 Tax=Mesonia sp. K7 TaxID=2218606 RepID=UPI000DA71577|nr:DUF4199 domain-containing protein [Mesonia sp. K7]PZD77913.1 hypothetical protein DNG35_07420 [Mesonia sp. K7]